MMKNILTLLMALSFSSLFAQDDEEVQIVKAEPSVIISVYGASIKASLVSNNDSNTITIYKGKEGKIVIVDHQSKSDTGMIRKFFINSIKEETLKVPFTSRLVGVINVNLNDIYSQGEEGKTYFLYTMSVPKDPNQAALVKTRRVLLTKIVIK